VEANEAERLHSVEDGTHRPFARPGPTDGTGFDLETSQQVIREPGELSPSAVCRMRTLTAELTAQRHR
jgi:hypothetical protein